jgi:chemotaxis protein methyltransferase CheR
MSSLAALSEVRDLTPREFEQIRQLAYEKFGLKLQDGKESLVTGRLRKLIAKLQFKSFSDYYRHVLEDQSGDAMTALIDALTTNHTSFFREATHFELLRKTILPRLRDRDRISIWCAASSTGEEPYSIAFSMLEELGERDFAKTRILATDISTRVLAKAQQAVYPAEHFDGIPAERLRRWLLRGNGQSSGMYRVKPEIRAAVEYKRLNLMESFSQLGPFPVIFCRNVMIYFDKPTQENVVNRMADCLEPGGYLLIGHSESLNGCKHPFRYVAPATYRKPEGK